jgi:dipeptidyl aminopeptidase/acylaminoacyl peptidase
MKKTFATLLFFAAAAFSLHSQTIQPSADYMFAQRDTCQLFMSVYDPAEETSKPCILFVFGGGFIMGDRNSDWYLPWFKRLTEDGYRVITIDYRLGLKGKGNIGVTQFETIYDAVETGVEDLYSATRYIIDNAEALGVDPSKIVIAGSSAGAIIVLQAEWHLCNRAAIASVLPEDFRYAGVMSFSGAVFSREGKPSYKRAPAPVLLMHGTADKIVTYNKTALFRICFAGSSTLAKIFSRNGYNYNIYRYEGHQHEIASAFLPSYREQIHFLESNVAGKEKRIVDATVSDPSIKIWNVNSLKEIYSHN